MAVTSYTLAITQGSTLSLTGSITQGGAVFDLTGYTIAGKIRRKFSDAAALQALTCTITDAAGGLFTVSLTAAETAALAVASTYPSPDATRLLTLGTFDVEITTGATVTRILEGGVTLSQEDTK